MSNPATEGLRLSVALTGSNRCRHLAGLPVNDGDALEIALDGFWIPGRYKPDPRRSGTGGLFLCGETKLIINDTMRFRWPRSTTV